MEAAASGARSEGGSTVGILPGSDATQSTPNPAIDLAVYTGMGQARNVVLVLSADALIAVGGEWGTLSEIAMARKHGRPLVLLDSWRLEAPGGDAAEPPVVASTPLEAVELATGMIAPTRETPSR